MKLLRMQAELARLNADVPVLEARLAACGAARGGTVGDGTKVVGRVWSSGPRAKYRVSSGRVER